MNLLASSLANICRADMLREKWLLAPSLRVGHQWLEYLALHGVPAVNVHVKTPRSLAIELASPVMWHQQVTLVAPEVALLLMDRVLRQLTANDLQYLTSANVNRRLAESLLASIAAVRLAGLDFAALDHDRLEVPAKGHDLARIAAQYASQLESARLVDYAWVLRAAIDQLTRAGGDEDFLLLIPDDLRLGWLERALLAAMPDSKRHTLQTDSGANAASPKAAASDLERLRWLRIPAEVPAPLEDGSVTLFRAVGEINEVRGVIRSCLSDGIGFDQVELLHTDAETYVPLIYEVFSTACDPQLGDGDELPVTFAEGIPVRYSRPGRSLAMWLSWIRDDFLQATMVRAIREGLLNIPGDAEERSGIHRLAAWFRGIYIGFGRERYSDKLDEQITGLLAQLDQVAVSGEDGEDESALRLARLQRQLRDTRTIRELLGNVLDVTPSADASAQEIVTSARLFVENHARRTNKLDQFAANRLGEEMRSLEQWLASDEVGTSALDIWQWLAELPVRLRVLGSGPRPGKLHVDHVRSGGHSGRVHTFIVGLDDSRFPGSGQQDPLLLDSERRRLASSLPTATMRLEETIDDFVRLLARLRGRVTLSFCCRNVVDDREMFPSPLLVAAYRACSGQPDADQSDLLAAIDSPVSFAPNRADQCLSQDEWWLWRACGPDAVPGADKLLSHYFPHLARGVLARRQRQSEEFTSFDGFVPAAGQRLDPTSDDGRIMSASSLQALGQCPLRFFYQYGLGIEPPDELLVDPTRWLDPLVFGSLMHELFEQFIREVISGDELPSVTRHQSLLEALLAEKVAAYRDRYPPRTSSAFQAQLQELQFAAATFLREEERHCREHGGRPVYLEASLGMPTGGPVTPLDTAEPISVLLPSGRRIKTRGRIDRIDRLPGGAVAAYAIWDYKSGSTFGYSRSDPFRQGRLVQPLLYVSIVAHQLRQVVDPQAEIAHFGFFFPSRRAAGHRVQWPTGELKSGLQLLELMCEVIRQGAFLPTNEHEDCKFCDYRGICGDVEEVASASKQKLANAANLTLRPFKELRCRAE